MKKRLAAAARLLGSGSARLLVFLSITFLVGEIVLRAEPLRYHVLYEYLLYLGRLARFDLGTNRDGVQILFFLQPALRNSLRLFLFPTVSAVLLAYYIGTRPYTRRSGRIAQSLRRLAGFVSAIPVYWLALLFFILAVETGWFPIGNVSSPAADRLPSLQRSLNYLHHLALPWISLLLYPVVVLSARVQAKLQTATAEPFVTALESRGFRRSSIVHRHLYPLLVSDLLYGLATLIPMLITYLVLVERVFNYPGLGLMTIGQFQGIAPVPDTSVSQAGLTYLGMFAIVIQTACRGLAALLLPRPAVSRAGRTGIPGQLRAVFFIAGSILLVAALAVPVSWPLWSVRLVLVTAAGAGFLSAVGHARRETGAPLFRASRTRTPLHSRLPGPDWVWARRFVRTNSRQIIIAGLLSASLVFLLTVSFLVDEPSRLFANPIVAERATGIPWLEGYTQRALVATRFILVPIAAAIAAVAVGTVSGVITGYHGVRAADSVADILETFPSVTVLVMLSAVTERSILGLMVTLLLVGGVRMYRRIRQEVEHIRSRDYIRYSSFIGTPSGVIMLRHILRNTAPLIAHAGVLVAVDLLILEANMSFLGNFYTIPVAWESAIPVAGWGRMLNETRSLLVRGTIAPALVPAAFLSVTVIVGRALATHLYRRGRS